MSDDTAPEGFNPFKGFIEQAELQFTPQMNQGGWTLVNHTDEDGKKHVYGLLVIADPNGIRAYYFTPEMLQNFLVNSQGFLQQLLQANAALNPLSVVSLADLKNLAVLNGQPIIWPPQN